jgi:hypothetical protein
MNKRRVRKPRSVVILIRKNDPIWRLPPLLILSIVIIFPHSQQKDVSPEFTSRFKSADSFHFILVKNDTGQKG